MSITYMKVIKSGIILYLLIFICKITFGRSLVKAVKQSTFAISKNSKLYRDADWLPGSKLRRLINRNLVIGNHYVL